ncbi:helix-turn-helix transcriptional regulator [Bacteroides sp. 519]|uniref:helix-turn-helix transcriptional regulator n=1 Tax=Bacteroides sp. 519 TaxID=2302937 RepID=UPI0013D2DC0C|nr:helix-turn-helix transcriptional regulator [Bacteroides sp. 519]
MKQFFTLLLIYIVSTSHAFATDQPSSNVSSADSIIALIPTLEGIEKLHAYQDLHQIIKFTRDPDEVVANIHAYGKEARQQNDILKECEAKFLEIEVYFNNSMDNQMDEVMPDYLHFMYEHQQWYFYFRTYNLKISHMMFQVDAAQAIEEAQKMYDIATRVNYKEGIAAALNNMGKGYNVLNRDPESTQAFEEALKMLDDTPRSDFRQDSYWYLSRQYAVENKIDQLLALVKQWETETNQMIAEGDRHEEHYVEFNEIYQGYAKAYARSGDTDKALEYLELARPYTELLGRGTERQLWNLEVNILYTMGRYNEMLPLLDKIYQSAVDDNQPHTMTMMLRQKARTYVLLGDAENTETYYEMYLDKRDSIASLNLESQLSEMRTKYDVDRHILEKKRNRNYAILAVALLVLSLVALVVWMLYSRRLSIKNKSLIERIHEQDRLHEQLQLCRTTHMETSGHTLPETDELFERITQLVEKEYIFIDPSLNRTTLATLVGSNETYVRRSIQNNTGQTVNDYLNSLRLRYARELLANHKLTIEAVAIESGFGARNTFHNIFKKKYGLTPDEFRRFVG